MIGILVNGGWLNLPENLKLVVVQESPLYFGGDFNIIPGTYTLPITVDNDANNRRLLKNVDNLHNNSQENDFECSIFFDGNLKDSGVLNWQETDDKQFKLQFFANAGALHQLTEKGFQDYDWGGEISIYGQTMEADFDWFKSLRFGKTTDTAADGFQIIESTCLIASKALERVFEQEGYKMETTFFDNAIHQKLAFWKPWYFRHPNQNDDTVVRDMVRSVPHQYISAALKGMAKMFCWVVFVDSTLKKVNIKTHDEILENPLPSIDYTSKLVSNIQRKQLHQNDTPAVKEFEYDHFDGLDSANSQADDLASKNLLPSVESIANLPLPSEAEFGDVIFITNDLVYISHLEGEYEASDHPAQWDIDNPFQDLSTLSIANKGKTISSALVPPFTRRKVFFSFSTPMAGGPVTHYNTEDTTPTTDEGYIFIRYERDYCSPFAVHNDTTVLSDRALTWQGSKGLHETYWVRWLAHINKSFECECTMLFSYTDILTWNPFQPITLWDEASGGYHQFYFKERRTTLTMTGIEPSKQKLVQLK